MGSDGHSKYPYFPKSLVKVCKSNYFKKIAMYKEIVLVLVLHYLFGGHVHLI